MNIRLCKWKYSDIVILMMMINPSSTNSFVPRFTSWFSRTQVRLWVKSVVCFSMSHFSQKCCRHLLQRIQPNDERQDAQQNVSALHICSWIFSKREWRCSSNSLSFFSIRVFHTVSDSWYSSWVLENPGFLMRIAWSSASASWSISSNSEPKITN